MATVTNDACTRVSLTRFVRSRYMVDETETLVEYELKMIIFSDGRYSVDTLRIIMGGAFILQ
jgi:hypothetical protein